MTTSVKSMLMVVLLGLAILLMYAVLRPAAVEEAPKHDPVRAQPATPTPIPAVGPATGP